MTSTPHNPDGRDVLEFADAVAAGTNPQPLNDLERTYLHVHTAMRGESAAIPASQKLSTWEDVMSTLTLAPERPVSNRTKRQRGPTTPPRTSARRRLQWTPMASIAAAVLVVLASMGIWRMNTVPNDSLPPLAPQVAGITSGDDIALQVATPEATAVEVSDGSRSIPIVQHVDERPMDGPVIWLTTSGDVMYDDGMEVTTIATDVTLVQPYMANTLMFNRDGEEMIGRDGTPVTPTETSVFNISTGDTLNFNHTPTSPSHSSNLYGQLDIREIETAPNLWSVVNFDSVQSVTLNDLTGGHFPTSATVSTSLAADGSAIAVASSQYQTESSSLLLQQSGLPAEVAVIPADLSAPTWVKVPAGVPAIGNMSLSPDGSKIALISADYFRGGSNMTVAVVEVETGELLVRTQRVESSNFSHFQWVNNNGGFVIVSDKTVQLFSLDSADEPDPTVIYETEGTVMLMPQFGQSHLLHLLDSSEELITTTPAPETSQFLILNADTLETISIDGEPWFAGFMVPEQMTRSLAPIPVSQDGETAILVHPITGEVYPDLIANVHDARNDPEYDPETNTEQILVTETVITAYAAPVSVVALADGNLAVFDTTEDSFDARIIELPAGAEGLQIMLSAGGDYLTIGSAWEAQPEGSSFLMLDLTDPNATWIQGEPGQMITFVEIREMAP